MELIRLRRLHRGREGRDRDPPSLVPNRSKPRPQGRRARLRGGGLRDLIRFYTRRGGVRTLEREIAKVRARRIGRFWKASRQVVRPPRMSVTSPALNSATATAREIRSARSQVSPGRRSAASC
jgi:hypothetical protein